MTKKFEKYRIGLSRLVAAVSLFFICTTQSYWDLKNEYITTALCFSGIVLVAVAALGRLWCSLYIAGYKNKRLITEGPYSICRNPLYLFSSLGLIGVGFATETLSFPIAFIILFSLYYPLVIKGEEKRLLQLYGDSFTEYRSKVPAFLPKFKGYIEPENYTVKPIVFRRHLFDAVWFIWIVGIIELIDSFRGVGVLPSIWMLY